LQQFLKMPPQTVKYGTDDDDNNEQEKVDEMKHHELSQCLA